MAGEDNDQDTQINYWIYRPNKVAPVVFATLFLISGLWHAYQATQYKSWKVTGLYPWAASLFVAGFVLRELGAFNTDSLDILIVGQVFIYCAPPVYEASNCLILGRTLYYVPYHSPMHPGRVITTYLGLDAIIEALTVAAAPRIANVDASNAEREAGYVMIKTSLCLFLFLFAAFLTVAGIFHHRCIRSGVETPNLRMILCVLYVSSFLILIRNFFRTVSFFQSGPNKLSPESLHEAYFWIFEACPMLLNTYLLNFFPPPKRLPANNKVYLARDGKTELLGPGWEDKRHWLLTTLDPFDIGGLIKGRDKKTRFWETQELEAGIVPTEQEERNADWNKSKLVGRGKENRSLLGVLSK